MEPPRTSGNWDQLLSAAQRNDPVSIYRLVVQEKVSPNHSNVVKQSALHIASLWGHVEAVGALLRLGADASVRNTISGATPLHCAVQGSMGQRSGQQDAKTAGESRVGCVRLLLGEGKADPNALDFQGQSALDYLDRVAKHHPLTDDLLVIRGLLLNSVPEPTLHRLLQDLDVQGLHTFLDEQGLLNQNLKNTSQDQSQNNLVNATDVRNGTPLQHAVSLLLQQHKQPFQTTNTSQPQPTQPQPTQDQSPQETIPKLKQIITLLLQAGADINTTITTNTNDSPGDKQPSTILLMCIDSLTQDPPFSSNDDTTTTAAYTEMTTQILEFLITDCRADPNALPSAPKDNNNDPIMTSTNPPCTPLHQATSLAASHFSSRNTLAAEYGLKVAQFLSNHGAKLNPPFNSTDTTTTTTAATTTTTAAPPAANTTKNTPTFLHDAARRGNLPLLTFLLHHTHHHEPHAININAPGRQGLTPLHFAARSGQVEVVRVLLEAGVRVEVVDGRGKTALDAAKANEKMEVVRLLEGYSGGGSSSVGDGGK